MFVLILFLILSSPLAAQNFFLSDSIGTQMQSTQSMSDSSWILSVENKGLEEERVLFKDQIRYKSWLIRTYLEEGAHRISEKYFYGDSLRTESILSLEDQILEELLYDSKGSLIVHKRYEYYKNGKLAKIIREGETELPDYNLKYRDEGSLISLKSDSDDRIEWRSGDFDRHYLDTLYLVEGSISSFLRYDEGKLEKKIIRNEQQILEESVFKYSDEGIIESEIISESDDKRRTERFFDKKGRLLMENIYLEDELYYSLIYTLKDGVLIRKQERNASIRNVWVYEYSEFDLEKKEPSLIRQFRNGQLLKVSEYLEDKTIETLYRNNEAVMSNVIEKDPGDDS
jgi:antitoxin component YwqK of YwqJK toxin-antitoxin module